MTPWNRVWVLILLTILLATWVCSLNVDLVLMVPTNVLPIWIEPPVPRHRMSMTLCLFKLTLKFVLCSVWTPLLLWVPALMNLLTLGRLILRMITPVVCWAVLLDPTALVDVLVLCTNDIGLDVALLESSNLPSEWTWDRPSFVFELFPKTKFLLSH